MMCWVYGKYITNTNMVLFASIRWCGEYDWKRYIYLLIWLMRILSTTRADILFWIISLLSLVSLFDESNRILDGSNLFAAFLSECIWGWWILYYYQSSNSNNGILLQLFYSNRGMEMKKKRQEVEVKEEKERERNVNCGFATFRLSEFYEDPFTTSIYFEWKR